MIPHIDDDAGYRGFEQAAYDVGHHAGALYDSIWRVCDRCGAVVVDTQQHDKWHHANLNGGDITITRKASA